MGLFATGAFLKLVAEPRAAVFPPVATGATQVLSTTGTVQGMSFAMLGGFRVLAADLAWLRAYGAWEVRDEASTVALLKLSTALDGGSLMFWLNGARMIAYDVPVWQIEQRLQAGPLDEVERTRIEHEQARRGIDFLAEAAVQHPGKSAIWVERANIELHRLHDLSAAAESYRRAAELRDAPYYPARIHAELLRRMGRKAEALEWLKQIHPRLPPGIEAAAADVVLARIRQLEAEISSSTVPDSAFDTVSTVALNLGS